jgi:hypothetical protein
VQVTTTKKVPLSNTVQFEYRQKAASPPAPPSAESQVATGEAVNAPQWKEGDAVQAKWKVGTKW